MSQDGRAPQSGRYRRWLLAAGILLTAGSAGYLALYAWRNWEQLPPLRLSWNGVAWLLTAAVLYFVSLLTTSASWFYALRALGGRLAATPAAGVALLSQIGKYAPGNVAHHFGRAALASERGLPLGVIAKATVMEIATAVLAGAMIAALAGAFAPEVADIARPLAPALPGTLVLPAALAAALTVALLGAAMWFRRARLDHGSRLLTGSVRMLGCYGLSFLFAGVSYYAVAQAFGPSPGLAACIAVYAIAWVAGFVTPGAPAGLGVRESVLVAALTASVGPAAIAIAIAHRLLTAVTDGAAAGVGAWLLSSAREKKAP